MCSRINGSLCQFCIADPALGKGFQTSYWIRAALHLKQSEAVKIPAENRLTSWFIYVLQSNIPAAGLQTIWWHECLRFPNPPWCSLCQKGSTNKYHDILEIAWTTRNHTEQLSWTQNVTKPLQHKPPSTQNQQLLNTVGKQLLLCGFSTKAETWKEAGPQPS